MTVNDLKGYVDKMEAHERELREQMIRENQVALDLALKHIEVRLHNANDMKTLILEDRTRNITRDVYETNHKYVEKRILDLECFMSNIQGRIWMFMALAIGSSAVLTAIVDIFAYLFHK